MPEGMAFLFLVDGAGAGGGIADIAIRFMHEGNGKS